MGFIAFIIFIVIISHFLKQAKTAVVNKAMQDFVALGVARNQQMENIIRQMQMAAMQHRQAEILRLMQLAQTRFAPLDQPSRQYYAEQINDALPERVGRLNPETGEWED